MTPPEYKEKAEEEWCLAKIESILDKAEGQEERLTQTAIDLLRLVRFFRSRLTQADALGYARGREEALGKWLRRWPSCSRDGLCREKWEGPSLQDDCYCCDQRQLLEAEFGRWSRAITAEPAKPCDVDDDLKCRTHPNGCEAWEPAKEVK